MNTEDHLYHISELLERIYAEMKEDRFLTFSEAADYCGVSVRTIKSWRDRGYVRTVSVGHKDGVMRSELEPMRKKTDNF